MAIIIVKNNLSPKDFEKARKDLFNNCAMGLQRAAQWYYLNPQGQVHRVFLQHARNILAKEKDRSAIRAIEEIGKIEKEITKPKKAAKIYLADRILTLGCLLRR